MVKIDTIKLNGGYSGALRTWSPDAAEQEMAWDRA